MTNCFHKTNKVIVIIFLGSILTVFFIQFFPEFQETIKLEEKRSLERLPPFYFSELASYPKKFDDYYRDNFVFRDFLIHVNNFLKYKIFKVSGSPKVLVGKEGWLFYNGDEARDGSSFSNHLGLLPHGYLEYFEEFKNKLEKKNAYLASLGISYVFVVAPDKWTVYPEYLPNGYHNESGISSSDMLLQYIKKNSNVNILDLRQKIKNKKEEGQYLYYKGDTHWNEMGGYLAYYEISSFLKKNNEKIKVRELREYKIETILTQEPMDLAKMLGLRKYEEIDYVFTPKEPFSYFALHDDSEIRNTHYYIKYAPDLPNVLVFRDSFMNAVIPHLADEFSSSIFVWGHWNNIKDIDNWLRKFNADIVIEETIERYLMPSIKI